MNPWAVTEPSKLQPTVSQQHWHGLLIWILYCLSSDVRLEVVIIFSFFPRFQIVSHVITAASVEQVTAEFNGFADSAKDTQVSQNFSQGSPAWFANNLPQINTELAKIFVGFTNQRLNRFFSFSNVIYAMMTYNPSEPCPTS